MKHTLYKFIQAEPNIREVPTMISLQAKMGEIVNSDVDGLYRFFGGELAQPTKRWLIAIKIVAEETGRPVGDIIDYLMK